MSLFAFKRAGTLVAATVATIFVSVAARAQNWDVAARVGDFLNTESDGKLKINAELRGRYDSRQGQAFGRDPDLEAGLYRNRLSMTYTPNKWIRVSGMVQDARAPWYGANAPNNIRDPADLHEAYFELRPDSKTGFGMTAGRMMLNYGEARLIGTPQWSNLARTYDHTRLYYKTKGAHLEFLLVSPVKVRIGEFNRPLMGERIWGMYNSFKDVWRKSLVEVYILRHDQNRPAGFTGGKTADGTDRLGVNTFGGRWAGPMSWGLKYSLEGALQNGAVGPAAHRAGAWFSSLSRRWMVSKRPLDISAEYKYASGTGRPQDPLHASTFDQLAAANHDKFGHQDLFGWRNIHNLRSQATLGVTKNFALNFMYANNWLASEWDALYNGSGKVIVRSASGAAGRHVGQETDGFFTYKYNHFTFGAGYGHFFKGEFIQKTTPGVSPVYAYIFHTYSF